jgi:serine/threonine protein kinase/Flp pilus assembly protein TadD
MAVSISGYKVLSKLGEGGMGAVFKAKHEMTSREVAIKVLPPKLAKDEIFRKRFLREARAAAAFNHPNITKVYDAGEQSGLYYMVMEYVEGESIANIIRATRPLKAEYALSVAQEVAEGLAHAHAEGIIHRDIKPDNIMLNLERVAKITDMGLAKKVEAATDDAADVTLAGTILGTPKYMSPEQIMHPDSIDHRADIYSLGATLYFMLTGRPPFDGESAPEIMVKVLKETPRYPKALPRPVVRLLKTLLAKKPQNRPQNAEDAAALIGETLEELRHPSPGLSQRSREPAYDRSAEKSRTGLVIALLGIAAVIAIVLVLALGTGGKSEPGPARPTPDNLVQKPPDAGPAAKPPVSEHPRVLAAHRKFKEVLKYAKNNPGDYAGITEQLESILKNETTDAKLDSEIRSEISSWMSSWEKAAGKEWERIAQKAEKLIAEGDYKACAELLDSFPEGHKRFGSFRMKCKEKAARLREFKDADAAIALMSEEAQQEFALDEIEDAQDLLSALREHEEKYQDFEPLSRKLKPVISTLEGKIARLRTEEKAQEFFAAVASLVRSYDFENALRAYETALRNPQFQAISDLIEREKRDTQALSHLCKSLKENLVLLSRQKKKISIVLLDGTKITGTMVTEDGTLLIKGEETYVVDLKMLHPDTIVAHSGLAQDLPQNQLKLALLYAHASFHEKASQHLDAAKSALPAADAQYYDTKLAFLKKKYPVPEKIKAVSKAQQLAYKAALWADIALDMQAAHRTKETAQALLKALELAPDSKQLASGAASTLTWLNDCKRALEITKRALSKHKDDPDLLQAEALAMHFSKKYRTALRRIDSSIKKDPDRELSHLIRAGVLNMLKKGKEARKAALKFWQLEDPGFAPMHMSDKEFATQLKQAQQSVKSGEYGKAGMVALQLVAARPENASAYNLLGLVSTHLNEYANAKELFIGAVLLNPRFAKAYINLGYVYLRLSEPDLALATLEAARKLRPTKEEKSALEQHLESAKQALKQRDTTAKSSYDQGKKLYSQRRPGEAVPKFRAAVSLKDSSPYWWLARCYHQLKQLQQAVLAYDKAILIKPEVHDNYYAKGLALRGLQEYEEAIEAFKKCSELHKKEFGKDHYGSWLGIAACYRKLGKTQETAAAQRKAQQLRPKR